MVFSGWSSWRQRSSASGATFRLARKQNVKVGGKKTQPTRHIIHPACRRHASASKHRWLQGGGRRGQTCGESGRDKDLQKTHMSVQVRVEQHEGTSQCVGSICCHRQQHRGWRSTTGQPTKVQSCKFHH